MFENKFGWCQTVQAELTKDSWGRIKATFDYPPYFSIR